MKQQVIELLKQKQTVEALELLKPSNVNAALILEDYVNQLKWHNTSGKDEWAREAYDTEVMVRIKLLLEEGPVNPFLAGSKTDAADVSDRKPGATVFISYSTKDQDMADAVTAYLNKNHFDFFFDNVAMVPGEQIAQRLTKEIVGRDFFVVLLSENSLRSPWVCLESSVAQVKLFSVSNRVIPLQLDNSLNDFDLIQSVHESILYKLADLDARIEKNKKNGIITHQYLNDEKTRDTEFYRQFDTVVAAYRKMSQIDISGEGFVKGMERLVQTISNLF